MKNAGNSTLLSNAVYQETGNAPDGDGLSDVLESMSGSDIHLSDTDGDGLSDGIEADYRREDYPPVDYDGDGVNDCVEPGRQAYDDTTANVVGGGGSYAVVTPSTDPSTSFEISVSSGCIQKIAENSAVSLTGKTIIFPFGLTDIEIGCLTIGEKIEIMFQFRESMASMGFHSFGPTSDNIEPHWYEFMFDGQTGAVIEEDTIRVNITDGGYGDQDLIANGIISLSGGPGREVSLADAIDGLKLFSGIDGLSAEVFKLDIDNNDTFGIAEVIFILQKVALLR